MEKVLGSECLNSFHFNPNKLYVEFRDGVTFTEPLINRCYTLTHSDLTANLFLTIVLSFAIDKMNAMNDEVLGEWALTESSFIYNIYLDVDGQYNNHATIAKRNDIFRRELPLALEAIRYGDRLLFLSHPELNICPILVYFISIDPQFNKIENWGTFSNYTIN